MNLLEKASTIAEGISNLTTWVGSGGAVVSQEEAQSRASICINCPCNKPDLAINELVAKAVKKFLAFKNELDLRVQGERSLLSCEGCGCQIRLLIWQPQDQVKREMTGEERAKTPSFCWKLKDV